MDRSRGCGAQRPQPRARAPRPRTTLGSVWQGSASPQGPPNRRLNALETSEIRPPGSATGLPGASSAPVADSQSAIDTLAAGSSSTESWSRPADRLETTVAATACTHSVQCVGTPQLARHRSALRSWLGPEPHRPPPRVKIINIVAGRLPPSVERPTHSRSLASRGLGAKLPSPSPVGVMSSGLLSPNRPLPDCAASSKCSTGCVTISIRKFGVDLASVLGQCPAATMCGG